MPNYDFKKQPVLLIQGAMDTETEYLIGQLDEPEEITCGNWKFYTGFFGKHAEPVVISRGKLSFETLIIVEKIVRKY